MMLLAPRYFGRQKWIAYDVVVSWIGDMIIETHASSFTVCAIHDHLDILVGIPGLYLSFR